MFIFSSRQNGSQSAPLVLFVRQCILSGYIKSSRNYSMQTLQQQQQVFKIEEKERKDSILEILSDKYCRTILESTMNMPKSATEITAEANIPLSTVYRRIQTLHDSKLLTVSGTITNEGKRLFLYKSKVRGIQSTFKNGKTEVKLILNN